MKLVKTLFVFAAMITASQAASISFDLAADTYAVNQAGTLLTGPTYSLYLGKYNGAALAPDATFAEISAGFTVLSTTAFLDGPAAGYATSGNVEFTDLQGFGGSQLFVLISNGTNESALITGFGAIPLDAAIPNSVAFSLDASNASTLTYLVGGFRADLNAAGGGAVQLNGIPEPSAALLGAIGALGLLRRRRN